MRQGYPLKAPHYALFKAGVSSRLAWQDILVMPLINVAPKAV
jgi:hypothetical protein